MRNTRRIPDDSTDRPIGRSRITASARKPIRLRTDRIDPDRRSLMGAVPAFIIAAMSRVPDGGFGGIG